MRMALVAVAVSAVSGLALAGTAALLLARLGRRAMNRWERRASWAALSCVAVGVGCLLYAALVEADWLEVTHLEVQTNKLPAGRRLRIVHLTDLHIDRWSRALRALPGLVNAEAPDAVLYTGDMVNSREGAAILAELSRQIRAPRFGVRGNQDIWYWDDLDLFGGGTATPATGRTPLPLGEGVALCGADYGTTGYLEDCLRAAGPAFTVLAYHTPDLVEDLAVRPDLYLYLAGHTHGGQVRFPFYGALMTLSKFDKKYEAGRYQVGGTTLYVNRGVGFEGGNAPRIRFLCRPEVAVIDIVGTSDERGR